MKVGVLTFHHTTNFGATLQLYALSTVIKGQGHDVEVIDYRPSGAVKYYQKQNINRHLLANMMKSWKMSKFLVSKMNLSPHKYETTDDLKNFRHSYDVVICGSDQIWCIDTPFRGFDPSYFLDFVSAPSRKISYAASFGKTKDLGEHKESICQLISQFEAISVRDSNSLQLIQQECNRQATKVLDPTFLTEYSQVISTPKIGGKYLLIYQDRAPMNLEEESFVMSIAKTENLEIISIGKYNKFNKIKHKNIIGVSPEEWLGYFSQASYVVTNTYHGTIFSLIFKKPFTVLSDPGKSNKIDDLLQLLELESRLFPNQVKLKSKPEEFINLDYGLVNPKLEKEILKSKTFLFNALEGKQG